MTDRLYNDAELAQFYDFDNEWTDDLTFCAKLAERASSVLDLGCGTGRFAASLRGKRVFGVDPARPMLDIARSREGGDWVTWVEADARDVHLGQRFDLVVMTGHAFQVFLTNSDQAAVCRTIAAHLAPGGPFIFDSRNPSCEEWLEWDPTSSRRTVSHPSLGTVQSWNDVRYDPATSIVTYETHYRAANGSHWSAESCIRFTTQAEIAEGLREAGLTVDRWLGDWSGAPLTAHSREIIPIGRHA
jgi:SAM-dependent methyltransferase